MIFIVSSWLRNTYYLSCHVGTQQQKGCSPFCIQTHSLKNHTLDSVWQQSTGSPCLTHKQKWQQQQQHRVAVPTSNCLQSDESSLASHELDLRSFGAMLAANEPRLNNSASWRFCLPATHTCSFSSSNHFPRGMKQEQISDQANQQVYT